MIGAFLAPDKPIGVPEMSRKASNAIPPMANDIKADTTGVCT
jgi:hypothetical protein